MPIKLIIKGSSLFLFTEWPNDGDHNVDKNKSGHNNERNSQAMLFRIIPIHLIEAIFVIPFRLVLMEKYEKWNGVQNVN